MCVAIVYTLLNKILVHYNYIKANNTNHYRPHYLTDSMCGSHCMSGGGTPRYVTGVKELRSADVGPMRDCMEASQGMADTSKFLLGNVKDMLSSSKKVVWHKN
jgi:hypothetical protein